MNEFFDTRHLLAAGPARPIADLIEPAVEALGFRLIRVILGGGAGRRLQVMAERADGSMSLEDCALLSRSLSDLLDREDPIQGSYALEVSSPGIRRPLSRLEDFDRWSGHVARIELNSPVEGRKRFRGRLTGVERECVAIEIDAAEAADSADTAPAGETGKTGREATRLVSIPARAIARACLLEAAATQEQGT